MANVELVQQSFATGEFDPKLYDRSDLVSYTTGVKKARNVFFIPQGGFKRRPGFSHVYELPTPTGNYRLISFVFSDGQKYLTVLYENAFLAFYNDLLVASIIGTGITDAQIKEITYAQSLDSLLIFHHSFHTVRFTRTGPASWTQDLVPYDHIPSYDFGDVAANAEISITGTPAATVVKSPSPIFFPYMIGYYIKTPDGGVGEILTVKADNKEVTVHLLAAFPESTYADGAWSIEEPAWSDTRGWPSCGEFAQGRLWAAATTELPNSVWASRAGHEFDFNNARPDLADYGISLAMHGSTVSRFHSVVYGRNIQLLADTGEYYIPISSTEAITPQNASIARSSSYGSAKIRPAFVDNALIFIRDGGRSLISSNYDFVVSGYKNTDLTLYGSHLFSDPVDMSYRSQTSAEDSDYIFVVNKAGELNTLCILQNENIRAWSRCITDGVITNTEAVGSDVYFVVDRIIDGVTHKFLEKFDFDLLYDSGKREVFETPVNTMSGLDRFDGEYVSVNRDNTLYEPIQVVGGSISWTGEPATEVQAGLEFPIVDDETGASVFVQTLPVILTSSTGNMHLKKKRIVEVGTSIYKTSHIIVDKNRLPIRRMGIDLLGVPIPKKTELISIKGLLGWDEVIDISVYQTQSLPLNLLALYYKVQI